MKIDRTLELRAGLAQNEAVLSAFQFCLPIRQAALAVILAPLTLGISLLWFYLRGRKVGIITNKRVIVVGLRRDPSRWGLAFQYVAFVDANKGLIPDRGTVTLHRPNGDPMVLRDVRDPAGVRDAIRAAMNAAVASGKILHPIF